MEHAMQVIKTLFVYGLAGYCIEKYAGPVQWDKVQKDRVTSTKWSVIESLRCVKARLKCKQWCSVSLFDHHNSTPLFVASV